MAIIYPYTNDNEMHFDNRNKNHIFKRNKIV